MNKRLYPIVVVALFLAAFGGCIMTATVIVTAKLSPNDVGQPIHITNDDYTGSRIIVDLTEDEDFDEYKDKIKNIDNIGFYLEASNPTFTPVTFQLFLEPDISKDWTDPEMPVDSGSYLIFTGVQVPARTQSTATGKLIVTWEESIQYINELDVVKEYLEKGEFSIYPNVVPRDNFNITVDSLVLIVTLTGEK
ncbi:MAG: hypothetical protein R3F48_14495 [Candidatus Zixiibacteriota bacterium]